jgi:hypothetical protein
MPLCRSANPNDPPAPGVPNPPGFGVIPQRKKTPAHLGEYTRTILAGTEFYLIVNPQMVANQKEDPISHFLLLNASNPFLAFSRIVSSRQLKGIFSFFSSKGFPARM